MMDVTTFVETLGGKPAAVFGLGLSGLATIRALDKAGAKIIAWDDNPESHAEAKKAGAAIKELDSGTLSKCACLILAPGVPLTHPEPHPVVVAAQLAGIEIIGDIEVLHRAAHGRKTIGLTGTNGKSTTTTLIHHIFQENGRKSALCGNIGMPVLAAKPPPKSGTYVLELSSFQLDLCPTFAPDIGILLNITPDHIDRHGSIEGYIASKERVFAKPDADAVIGVDDEHSRKLYNKLKETGGKRVIPISVTGEAPGGVYVNNNQLIDDMDGKAVEIGSLGGITRLHGQHNKQNAAAAYVAARLHGLEPEAILQSLKTYPGLAHRQYPVRTINGVAYVNDSKATNAEAAAKALMCFNNIYWIVGGKQKEGGLEGLQLYVNKIRHAFVIGKNPEEIEDWLEKHNVPFSRSNTIQIAVQQAHDMAQSERGQPGGAGVVLLSPACASYDQFKNFEERGNVFTDLVNALEEAP